MKRLLFTTKLATLALFESEGVVAPVAPGVASQVIEEQAVRAGKIDYDAV